MTLEEASAIFNADKDDTTAWQNAFARALGPNWGRNIYAPVVGFGACTDHNFIDTGMKKSWCKKCDKEGIFNSSKGIYE